MNLASGEERLSPDSVTQLACDPQQEFVYGFFAPASEPNTDRGHLLIEFRPVYFEFERWLAPHGNHSAGGYGILFVDAHDLARILRFVPTEAYPKSAAISSAEHLIVAQEGKTVLTHATVLRRIPPSLLLLAATANGYSKFMKIIFQQSH